MCYVNNNLSKLHVNYSYNGTDGINDVYESMSDMSSLHIWTDGNTKIGQELGLSQNYEGCEVVVWKGTAWRGGALAISGNGSPVMIGQNNGSNSIKWNPLALKSDLENVENKCNEDIKLVVTKNSANINGGTIWGNRTGKTTSIGFIDFIVETKVNMVQWTRYPLCTVDCNMTAAHSVLVNQENGTCYALEIDMRN
mgnify:CR=1 FL=1